MTSTNNTKKSIVRGVELVADTLIHGLQTSLPAGVTQLTVGGVTYQVADLIKLVQDDVKPWKDVRGARAIVAEAMKHRPEDKARLQTLLNETKVGLSAALGSTSEQLRNFGFAPKAPRRQLTAEEQALAAAKAKLTRELRHTMGSRQKAELTAETPAIEISPDGETTISPAPSSDGGGANSTP